MIEYTKIVKEVQTPSRKVCDVCGANYATDDLECEKIALALARLRGQTLSS